jgi:hypothetical protein
MPAPPTRAVEPIGAFATCDALPRIVPVEGRQKRARSAREALLSEVHLCLPGYRGELLYAYACVSSRGGSALDPADEATLELGKRAELLEWLDVLFASECGKHTSEIADRGH